MSNIITELTALRDELRQWHVGMTVAQRKPDLLELSLVVLEPLTRILAKHPEQPSPDAAPVTGEAPTHCHLCSTPVSPSRGAVACWSCVDAKIEADVTLQQRVVTLEAALAEQVRGGDDQNIACPFCLCDGMDLPGLAAHITRCDKADEAQDVIRQCHADTHRVMIRRYIPKNGKLPAGADAEDEAEWADEIDAARAALSGKAVEDVE